MFGTAGPCYVLLCSKLQKERWKSIAAITVAGKERQHAVGGMRCVALIYAQSGSKLKWHLFLDKA
jgi:hypothetical protein